MIIASYRNTERGIRAAQRKPVVLVVVPVVTDSHLILATAVKYHKFIEDVALQAGLIAPLPTPARYRVSFDRIVHRMCHVFGVSIMDLRARRRNEAAVNARQAIYYWSWRLTALSAAQIGWRLGGRDHTTILHGVTVYQRKRAQMGRHLRELRKAAI